jgi:hypothetical protein
MPLLWPSIVPLLSVVGERTDHIWAVEELTVHSSLKNTRQRDYLKPQAAIVAAGGLFPRFESIRFLVERTPYGRKALILVACGDWTSGLCRRSAAAGARASILLAAAHRGRQLEDQTPDPEQQACGGLMVLLRPWPVKLGGRIRTCVRRFVTGLSQAQLGGGGTRKRHRRVRQFFSTSTIRIALRGRGDKEQ